MKYDYSYLGLPTNSSSVLGGDEPLVADPNFDNWSGANDLTNWSEVGGDAGKYVEQHANGVRMVVDASSPGFNILATPGTGNISTIAGESYRYRIVVDSVSGTLSFRYAGGSGQFLTVSTPNTYEDTFVAALPGNISIWRSVTPIDAVISYYQVWRTS